MKCRLQVSQDVKKERTTPFLAARDDELNMKHVTDYYAQMIKL